MALNNLMIVFLFILCVCEVFSNQNGIFNTHNGYTSSVAKKIDIPGLKTAIPNFLRYRLSKYPEWVVEHKFDPSAPIQTPITLISDHTGQDVTLTICNQYIQGISNAVGKVESNGYFDLDTGTLRGYIIPNIDGVTFGGDYEVVGSVGYLGITFTGSGNFTGIFSLRFQDFTYKSTKVDSTGKYLNLTSAEDVNYSKNMMINGTTAFIGITWSGQPGDFSDAINDILYLMYFKYLVLGHDGITYDDPASWLLRNFVTRQFNTTTIEEILTYESSGSMPKVDNRLLMLLFAVGIIRTSVHSFLFQH